MKISNVHERHIAAAPAAVGALIDGLAGPDDALWPSDRWPAMRFDRPLQPGGRGGHGPIRYDVEGYEPGRRVRFRFTAPAGLEGWHGFEVERSETGATLRHVLEARARGRMRVFWPIVLRPLHDALIEDALDRAEAAIAGRTASPAPFPGRVRALRRMMRPRPATGSG